ncbi:RUN domain-containing protein 1 [Clonorchis sinensis]|uniref:RUN domain-containing protein 1 n=1 Tax=Clonorchis sinensis TaxID=79923 RepID=A0A8T1MT46_CLOSI|nr:RUN domain-containing protein 1 [Clonorchis sinensis]
MPASEGSPNGSPGSRGSDELFSIIDEDGRPKERWAPLGATSSPEPSCSSAHHNVNSELTTWTAPELSKLVAENEQMNHALMALTSHFAQVQFRLGQVLSAKEENREEMLRSLEQFASRGIPDLQLFAVPPSIPNGSGDVPTGFHPKPQKLIEELKSQLDELERFAYETGEQKQPPNKPVLEKQRLVLEELSRKLELDIENLGELSNVELKTIVNSAVQQFLNPMKVNEQLVEQLKTQVVDLERFIDFLHGSGTCGDALMQALHEFKRAHQLTGFDSTQYSTPGIQLGHSRHLNTDVASGSNEFAASIGEDGGSPVFRDKRPRDRTITLLQRAVAILHIFASAHFGPSLSEWTPKREGKRTSADNLRNSATVERAKAQHWGIARAQLEVAINLVLEKVEQLRSLEQEKSAVESHQTSCIMRPTFESTAINQGSSGITYSNRPDQSQSRPPVGSSRSRLSVVSGELKSLRLGKKAHLHDTKAYAIRTGSGEAILSSSNQRKNSVSSSLTTVKLTSTDTREFLYAEANRLVIHAVRRQLCPALRDLIEHGLVKKSLSTVVEEPFQRNLLWPFFGCLASRRLGPSEDGFESVGMDVDNEINQTACSTTINYSRINKSGPHAWHVFLKFYYMKNGQVYNESPARKLSESFDLDSYGGKAITLRQRFFNAMGTVLETHDAYHRSDDSRFKSFISIALNEGRLVQWLRMVLKNQSLVSTIYQPWSYTLSTGFDDALHSLNRLSNLGIQLPYDYSVRHLREIGDAF